MKDRFLEYAKDPACVLYANADNQGSWHSPIREQYQPRNFVAGKTVIWDDFITFFKSIGTNDLLFRMTFRPNSYSSGKYIFQNSGTSTVSLGVYSTSNAYSLNTNTQLLQESAVIISLIPPGDAAVFYREHTIIIKRENGVLNVTFDGVLKSTSNGTNKDTNTLSTDFITQYDVSFSEIYIEDLDAGTSWSAPHDVLWQSNPQPSTVMRNFATETERWYGFQVWCKEQDWVNHDFEFTCEYQNTRADTGGSSLYPNAGMSSVDAPPFGLLQYANNAVVAYCKCLTPTGSDTSYYSTTLEQPGAFAGYAHTFKIAVVGTTLQIHFDGQLRPIVPNLVRNIHMTNNEVLISLMGYIKFGCRNLTTGSHWGYPSIAEKVRLLTKYNCDTSNLDFRLASTSENNWYVKTGLSFAGWSRPLTVIGRMYIAPDSGGDNIVDYDTNVNHPIISHGYSVGDPTSRVFSFYYSNQYNSNRYRFSLTTSSGASIIISAIPPSPPHGRDIIVAMTIDPTTGTWAIYENGVLLNSAITQNLIGFSMTSDTSNAYNDPVAYLHQRISDWQNRNDIIDYVAVFDKVKTDTEIKYLSYDRDDWIDLILPVEAGTINIATESIPELEWTLPDGTKSTASTLNQTVEAGVFRMKCYKYGKTFSVNNSPALVNTAIQVRQIPRVYHTLYLYSLPGLTGTVSDLPRATHTLSLNNLPGLTGTVADLPRVANNLYLYNLPGLTGTAADLPRVTNNLILYNLAGLTGTTADLPRVTNDLYLYDLPGLTGTAADLPRVTNALTLSTLAWLTGTAADLPRVTNTLYLNTLAGLTGTAADLPRVTNALTLSTLAWLTGTAADLPANTGPTRLITHLAGITGALPVVSTNTNVSYYSNSQVTPAEYDQTIQNIVDAGGVNGTLRISNTRTSASDANIATLQSRGWTVTEY